MEEAITGTVSGNSPFHGGRYSAPALKQSRTGGKAIIHMLQIRELDQAFEEHEKQKRRHLAHLLGKRNYKPSYIKWPDQEREKSKKYGRGRDQHRRRVNREHHVARMDHTTHDTRFVDLDELSAWIIAENAQANLQRSLAALSCTLRDREAAELIELSEGTTAVDDEDILTGYSVAFA